MKRTSVSAEITSEPTKGLIVKMQSVTLIASGQMKGKEKPMDLIKRQDAIDALGERPLAWTQSEYETGLQNQYDSDLEAIQSVPSAQPKQAVKDCRNCKHGKYNDYHDTYFCYNAEDCSNWDKWETSAQQWIPFSERHDCVLDKIRAEIEALTDGVEPEHIWNVDVLAIIDKYKAESEE